MLFGNDALEYEWDEKIFSFCEDNAGALTKDLFDQDSRSLKEEPKHLTKFIDTR